MSAVKAWVRRVTCEGPSAAAIPISANDEDYIDAIESAHAWITYFVSHQDRHVVVKDISA